MVKRLAAMLFCSAVIMLCSAQDNHPVSKKTNQHVIFSVAGNTVTTDEFVYLYKKNHQNKPAEFTKEKIDEYLKLFIDFKLKVQEAKRRGMDTTAAFLKEYNSYRAELRKPHLPDNSLMDSLVRLTYDRMKEEVRAFHILITLKSDPTPADTLTAYNKIVALRNRLTAGEDFQKAAVQYSEDPSAKQNRGDLGYFTAMQMVFPFETAAYTTKVGDVSQPVRTRFGYHLLLVTDRRPSQGEVEVSHIMVRTKTDDDQERAKNIIFTIDEQLQKGVPWADLVKQYSEDPSAKEQGGKLRPFGTGGMATAPEFEKAAFNLQKPGDVSDPVKTQFGWHILRLERKIPLASFDVVSPALKSRIARDERTTLSRIALQEKLRRRYSYHENEDTRSQVAALADSSLSKGHWKAPAPGKNSETLFTLQGKPLTKDEFLSFVGRNQRQQTGSPAKIMEQLYNDFVESSIMELVEKGIITETPTYSFLLKEYYEGILLFEIMEKEVWNKASDDSIGQHKFYEANLTRYQAGERVKAVVYSSASANGMPALEQLVKNGDERKIQEYIIGSKTKMEAGYFKKDEKEVFSKIPWSKGVYSAENKGMYYLAWIKDILPPGAMSFEEARPAIISDYQADMEKRWLGELKKKYAVKVNGKGKQYVIQTLQGK